MNLGTRKRSKRDMTFNICYVEKLAILTITPKFDSSCHVGAAIFHNEWIRLNLFLKNQINWNNCRGWKNFEFRKFRQVSYKNVICISGEFFGISRIFTLFQLYQKFFSYRMEKGNKFTNKNNWIKTLAVGEVSSINSTIWNFATL